jgi:hypothetical protein
MIKFLTTLLAVIEKVFAFLDQQYWKQQGRQETIKEMNDELNRQIELGEAATSIPDPEHDERLRSRFDRSRSDQ